MQTFNFDSMGLIQSIPLPALAFSDPPNWTVD